MMLIVGSLNLLINKFRLQILNHMVSFTHQSNSHFDGLFQEMKHQIRH